jgi:hypothetical protein
MVYDCFTHIVLFVHNFSVDFLSFCYAFDVSISREIKAQRYVLMVPCQMC